MNKHRSLLWLLLLIVLVKLFSLSPQRVEQWYATGIYPAIGQALRTLFGWIPFSIGDLFYLAAVIWILVKLARGIRSVLSLGFRAAIRSISWPWYIRLLLIIYLVFNILWGLNYDRAGIASQLGLQVNKYSKEELSSLTCLLQDRLNTYAAKIDSIHRLKLNQNKVLFKKAYVVYGSAHQLYPFLNYKASSQKRSLYTPVGHFMGFTGYYNPFTGEAQLKDDVPVFLKPFIICHEIGHQLGYAKENEANFVSYLACRNSNDPEFLYSIYFDMYRYALNDLSGRDHFLAFAISKGIHPRVLHDLHDLKAYFLRTRNPIEPLTNKFYDQYLKLNNQPKGFQTYNEVVAWLIAFEKKYGAEAL